MDISSEITQGAQEGGGGVGDVMAFESFCIVCDRAIAPPKEREEVVKVVKKKAAGTIRVKNPDGTVTTRTANGTKTTTTRPPLRRGPSSQNRLAVAAAANNASSGNNVPSTTNNTTKIQPLTRTKTSEGDESPFFSTIYCSKACAMIEQTRCTDLARRMSLDPHNNPNHRVEIITSMRDGSPYGPPSPLYIGDSSDTSSNPDANSAGAGPACSAPNAIEFFRISREGPDDAWRAVTAERQRRSSVHPNVRPAGPTEMARQASQQSTHLSGEPSSDSLESMWYSHPRYYSADQSEVGIARSTSGNRGDIRMMTPMLMDQQATINRRSMSSEPAPIPTTRPPLPRSNLSQVSLTAGSPSPNYPEVDLPPEFGSAPNHTYNLWNSYHSAFPVRDASGTSANSHRGFVFPGSSTPSSTGIVNLPIMGSRRDSTSSNITRPLNGTIRAKSRTDVTWDSFGKEQVEAKSRARCGSMNKDQNNQTDCTPKQSIEVDGGGWKIRYILAEAAEEQERLSRGDTVRQKSRPRNTRANSYISNNNSHSDEDDPHTSESFRGALPIPGRQPSYSAARNLSIASNRTPTMTSPVIPVPSTSAIRKTSTPGFIPSQGKGGQGGISIPNRPSSVIPDLAALRLGTSCAAATAAPVYLSTDSAGRSYSSSSVPKANARSTFNWDEFEKKGGRVYEIPKALKVNTQKAGLFFFK